MTPGWIKEIEKRVQHEEACVWWYSANDENPNKCNCRKDEALNYNPTEVR